jgi:hypothetical protein
MHRFHHPHRCSKLPSTFFADTFLLPHFLLHSQVIATLTTSAEAKSAKARRRQSLTSSQGSQDTNREKGHDEAESVASNGNLNGVKEKDKKKLLSVAFD